MSDNMGVNPGSTISVRSKEVSAGLHLQLVAAGEHVRVFDGVQSLTLTSSSQTLTVPGSATHALIYSEGAASTDCARYWQDGTAPTASVGKRLFDDQEMGCASPSTFKAIIGAGSPILRIEYYHYA